MPANLPDFSDFAILRGNLKWSVSVIALARTLAAFAEEMVGRDHLMDRVAELGKYTRAPWMVSLIALNVAFGSAHSDQEITGMIDEGLMRILLGWMYLRYLLPPLGPSRRA